MGVAGSEPQGAHYHADVIGSLAPLTGNEEESKCLTVLRVKLTTTRFPTNSLNTPMDYTSLHSMPNVCRPRADNAAVRLIRLN